MTKPIIWEAPDSIKKKSKLTKFLKHCNVSNYDDLEKKRNAVQKDFDNSKTLTEKKIPEIIISLSDQIFEKILGEKKKSNLSEFKKFTESSK